MHLKKYVMEQCKIWNLMWIGKNIAATIEPAEMEVLMGFPENHTRGLNRTKRFKALGNAFQEALTSHHSSLELVGLKLHCTGLGSS